MGMYGNAFAACIRNGLVPELEIGTAAIRDNPATHKTAQAAAALKAHGWRVLYPPPYAPDPDPIEMAFAKPKARLSGIGARPFTDMVDAIAEIRDLFAPGEGWKLFSRRWLCLGSKARGCIVIGTMSCS